MKNIINNINKIALIVLSLFLAVGVVSCGCDDKDKGDNKKIDVTLSLSNNGIGKMVKTSLTDDNLTTTLIIKLEKGNIIDEENAAKVKVTADGFFKGENDLKNGVTLKDLGISKLGSEDKEESTTLDLRWCPKGKKTLAEVQKLDQADLANKSIDIKIAEGNVNEKSVQFTTKDITNSGTGAPVVIGSPGSPGLPGLPSSPGGKGGKIGKSAKTSKANSKSEANQEENQEGNEEGNEEGNKEEAPNQEKTALVSEIETDGKEPDAA